MSEDRIDLGKKEHALAFMNLYWLEQIRREYHEKGTIHPRVAIFATLGPDGEPLPTVLVRDLSSDSIFAGEPSEPGDRSKNLFCRTVQELCLRLRAVGVALVLECWGVTTTPEDRKKYKQVADHPGKREVLLASLDHIAFPKALIWEAKIERVVSTNGCVGPFRVTGKDNVKGRFTGLFPRELWS